MNTFSHDSSIQNIKKSHKEQFGVEPSVIATTPCRFHILGEHTWFFGGKTISMAINRFVSVSLSPRNDDNLYFHFVELDENRHIALSGMRFRKEDKWANSIKCIIHGFVSNGLITDLSNGFDFCISSDLPQSAGMGVTTAIKVCAASAINEYLELECSDSEIFNVFEKGDREFLKENGVNHFSENITAMFAKQNTVVLTNHLEKSITQDSVKLLDFNFPGKSIYLVDAKVPRVSMWDESSIMTDEYRRMMDLLKIKKSNVFGGWIYNPDMGEVNDVFSNLRENDRRHLYGVINEHKCVLEIFDALSKKSSDFKFSDEKLNEKNFALFARAVNESHENMRDLYDISCPEIDWILKRLLEINPNPDKYHNPISCGRITGQGFGRSLFVILDDDKYPIFEEKLNEYTKIFGFKTVCYKVISADGVKIYNKAYEKNSDN